MTDLRALTVHEPFATVIVRGWKDVENRPWPWPQTLPLGTRIAIHASRRPMFGSDSADRALRLMLTRGVGDLAHSAIIGTVRVTACTHNDVPSEWAVPGQWHWLLNDAQLLDEPIPCRGHLSLWHVPDEIATRIPH